MHCVGEIGSIKSTRTKENGEKGSWKLKSRSSSRGIHKGKKGPKKYIVDVPDNKEKVVKEEQFEEEVFGPWSDWFWSEDYQVFYRGSLDVNEMWDYEYDYKVSKREIPRFVPPINIEFVEGEKVELQVAMELPDLGGEEYTWVMGSSGNMKMGMMDGEEVQDVEKMKGKGGNEGVKDRNISEKQMGMNIEHAGKEAKKESTVTKDFEKKHGGRKR
ncbi:hypothetical protein EAF04_004924 [Stromatinia cepivora]|nr:hypothetical protein EAF04_004924 [Stromatinia cepivora]